MIPALLQQILILMALRSAPLELSLVITDTQVELSGSISAYWQKEDPAGLLLEIVSALERVSSDSYIQIIEGPTALDSLAEDLAMALRKAGFRNITLHSFSNNRDFEIHRCLADPLDACKGMDFAPRWMLAFGGGVAVSYNSDASRLDKQLSNWGDVPPWVGGELFISLQRRFLSWFYVGTEFLWNGQASQRQDPKELSQSPASLPQSEFHHLLGFVTLTAAIENYHPIAQTGTTFGLQLGVGVGGLVWRMRGHDTTGWEMRLRPALVAWYHQQNWSHGIRLNWSASWIQDLGPMNLGCFRHDFGIQYQAAWRW